MPIWSEEELRSVSCMYPQAVDWEERFAYLGGVPRLVLEKTTNDPSEILVQACQDCQDCQDCALDSFLSAVGPVTTICDDSKVIHHLLHLNSTVPYDESSVIFASDKALDLIVSAKMGFFKRNADGLLSACEANPLAAQIRGCLYERYAINALENGGNFTYRRLVHGKVNNEVELDETLYIPSSRKQIANEVLEIQTIYQLHVPKSKKFKGIVAWIPSIGGFQITLAKSHDSKDAIAADLKLPEGKLFWVLPESTYRIFSHKAISGIQQFAVLVPYPEEHIYA